MIIQGKLSFAQQAAGRKYWHIFNILNAMSFVCVADSVLYLFALEIGCPQYLIPVIASFMYIGFLAMPLGKVLSARIGAGYTITFFWTLRSFFALISAISPFIISWFGVKAGITTLLIGSLGFFASRSAGVVAINPILGEITLPEQRGKFTALIFRNFNIVALLGLVIISLAMREYASQQTFQIIISCGVIAGLVSAFVSSKIKETTLPKESAQAPIWDSLKAAFKNNTGRKLILANIAVMSGIVLVLPISITAVKTGYNVTDSTALVCAIIQFGGGILIASISGIVSSHSGPRPVILIAFSLLIISALLWIVAPAEFSIYHAALIFLLNGAAGMGAPMALTHYFLNIISAKDRVGYSLFISMASGTCAGLFSFVIGSGLLKLLPEMGYSGMTVFKIYFSIIIFLLLGFFLVLLTLDKLKDWKVGKLLGLAFAPRDIRALLLLNKLDKTGSQSQELEEIKRLKNTRSAMSTDKILSYLETPKYLVRMKALLALHETPFGDKVKKRVMEELKYGTYTTAPAAAMLLGSKKVKDAIPLLREKLDSDNIYLIGRAMVALTQLEDKDSYNKIKDLFVNSDNQFILISGATALSLMEDSESLKLLLHKTLQDNIAHSVRAEIYCAIAEKGGVGDDFYKLFKLYFTKKDLQNPLCIAFLENVRKEPMDERFIKMLNKFNESQTEADKIIAYLIPQVKDSSNELLHIVTDFLTHTPHHRVGKVLLYCLLGIYRQNGEI
jgi:MFS family permease